MAEVEPFDKFSPDDVAFPAMRLSHYVGTLLDGTRTCCHAAALVGGEIGHWYYAAGSRADAAQTRCLAIVFRVGGDCTATGEGASRFNEFLVYPRGDIPANRYNSPAHEFVVLAQADVPVQAGDVQLPSPALLLRIWRLILRLRETGHTTRCQSEFDAVVASARQLVRASIPRPVAQALEELQAHWESGRPSAELAAKAGVSTAYLCRQFKQSLGVSISEYLRLLRLSRAAGLLWGTLLPIDEIAAICGFFDQPHLTHQMLTVFALTPSSFRRLAPCLGKTRLAHVNCLADPFDNSRSRDAAF